jgi:hypothetical protein
VTTLSSGSPDEQVQDLSIACHVHSDWSYDGKWSLDELVGAFGRRDYRVLMMTEHDRNFTKAKWLAYQTACAQASSAKLLLVPGLEYSDPTNVVHVLVWGCFPFLGQGLSTSALLAGVRKHGGVAVLAHPSRLEAWRHFDPSWASYLLGIESWNRKTDGWAPSRAASELLSVFGLLNFTGLDFHDCRQFFPLSMRVPFDGEVNERSILGAFRSRRATPCVFGRPLAEFLNPVVRLAFSTAERIRRPFAKNARRVFRYPSGR